MKTYVEELLVNSIAGNEYKKVVDVIKSSEPGSLENLKAHITGCYHVDDYNGYNQRKDSTFKLLKNPHEKILKEEKLLNKEGYLKYPIRHKFAKRLEKAFDKYC